jgi:hypothetical protein
MWEVAFGAKSGPPRDDQATVASCVGNQSIGWPKMRTRPLQSRTVNSLPFQIGR